MFMFFFLLKFILVRLRLKSSKQNFKQVGERRQNVISLRVGAVHGSHRHNTRLLFIHRKRNVHTLLVTKAVPVFLWTTQLLSEAYLICDTSNKNH